MPIISIIIPIFNGERMLFQKCLDSIKLQDFDEIEIVIIDDGSDNEHSQMIDLMIKDDNRIKCYHQEKKGVSAARNYGMEVSQGKYIVFMDSDDELMPGFLHEAYHIAEDKDADILIGYAIRVSADEATPIIKKKEHVAIKIPTQNWIKKYHVGYLYNNGNIVFGRGPWARFIKAEIGKAHPFFTDVCIGEDVLWNLSTIASANRAFIVEEIWYRYNLYKNSVTCKYDPEIHEKLVPFYNYLPKFLNSTQTDRRYYYNRLFNDLRNYIFRSNYGHPQDIRKFIYRWKSFNSVCNVEPWNSFGANDSFMISGIKHKFKVIAFRTKILFLIWSIKYARKK